MASSLGQQEAPPENQGGIYHMEEISRRFYGDRASEAADAIAGTKRYRDRARKRLELNEALAATLTEGQAGLLDKWESESSELECVAQDAIYKAGFLDGIAMAMTSVTCADRISEAERGHFHLGYEEGKAVGASQARPA
jgi:hypothetical protein